MKVDVQQRAIIKYYVTLNKSPEQIKRKLTRVFGENTLNFRTMRRWISYFSKGRSKIDNKHSPGRPKSTRTPENIERVRQLVNADKRITLAILSEELGINEYSVHEILRKDLKMRKLGSRIVPRKLSDEQKQRRIEFSRDLLISFQNTPNLENRIVTGDETWLYQYDPESKQATMQWLSPTEERPFNYKRSRSRIKIMMTVFFDRNGIIYVEFLPPNETINQTKYKETLEKLQAAIQRHRPNFNNDWFLHHDNCSSHTALSIKKYLQEKNLVALDHSPYSPDLAPNDFYLFPKVKKFMKGRRFNSIVEIQYAIIDVLKKLESNDFQQAFEFWKSRLQKCLDKDGNYFEGERNTKEIRALRELNSSQNM